VHRMQLKEMTRKLSEMTRNVTRSGEKYEVLKSQKSTLQTLVTDIESTLSDIAEREKMYGNELFVLQSEMTEKERVMRAVEQRVKDSKHAVEKCRLDENRHRIGVRRVGDKNSELGLEVSQLRDILKAIETDIHSLRSQYVEAVTHRNSIGCLLIDRNDELLLLYEQHDTMTQMLTQHETEMAAGTEHMVRISRETEDMKRRAEVARGQIPSVQAWGEKVHAKDALSRQLEEEKQQVEHLSTLLETPTTDKSTGFTRARLLTGDDPDAEVLAREIEDGERRVEAKRALLLELELQVKELSSVNARLRTRASEGREKAVRAGMEMNDTRAARERVSRQLMAAVSELSMWQARAVRLERDRRQREAELQEMQSRQQAGQQPDDQCEADWMRRERDKQRLREVLTSVRRSREEEEMLDRTLRSTAEVRPNAYINQSDQLGLPKPYGGLAPFKPSVLGAQMRHFRIPQQREIQL
jgi:chromosome segregation ATPase